MGNVIQASFGDQATGYDEAVFRQALREEVKENGGELTRACIGKAFERSLEIATPMKEEDPDQFEDYVNITYILLIREHEAQGG